MINLIIFDYENMLFPKKKEPLITITEKPLVGYSLQHFHL